MTAPVLQSRLPEAEARAVLRPLPGMAPLDVPWVSVDEAYAAQMALRDALVAQNRAAVLALRPEAEAAAAEMLALLLAELPPGFVRDGARVTRPDGVTVDLDADSPLASAARLVQEDLCLLTRDEGAAEHVLSGAALCFPAGWSLREKLGQPLGAIHAPVHSYSSDMARRVQRLFDGIRPGQPIWRQNALLYTDPTLHLPQPEPAGRPPRYLRSERQVLIRLPETGAVLFSIHTYIVPLSALPKAARAALLAREEGAA